VPIFCCRVKQFYKHDGRSIDEIVPLVQSQYRKFTTGKKFKKEIVSENALDRNFVIKSLTDECPNWDAIEAAWENAQQNKTALSFEMDLKLTVD